METEFLKGLIKLNYGEDVAEELKKLASSVSWAKGWPDDKKAFWNGEAFMWSYKINKERREVIKGELSALLGKNLDLGCGAYSYLPSVGFDISEKMLELNDNCAEKIVGDLEKDLPFSDNSFDSVTAVFVLNYVENYKGLLAGIKRVLKDNGNFVVVLSAKKLNDWQRQKEVNSFSSKEWKKILEEYFTVKFYEKEEMWFFMCRKESTPPTKNSANNNY